VKINESPLSPLYRLLLGDDLINPRDVKDSGRKRKPKPREYEIGQIGDLTAYFYKGKYLPAEVVKKCYRKGQITNVNKTDTGNGFTYSALTLQPEKGKIKVLIEPNLEVIRDKNKIHNGVKYLYLHSDSPDSVTNISSKTEVIVTSTDTFRHILLPYLRKKNFFSRIESVTIDESHNVPKSASYRASLRDYWHSVSLELIKSNKEVAVVNVSATCPLTTNPFYYQEGYAPHERDYNPYKVDILLAPIKKKKKLVIRLNNDEEKLIEEIKDLRSRGEKIIVFTNQSRIINQFIEEKEGVRVLSARLIAGKNILRLFYSKAKVEPDEDFIISTSSGYEGWSANGKGWNIYFFSDCNYSKYTIGLNGTEQGIGRPREGTKSITFCEIPFQQTKDKYGNIKKLVSAFSELDKIEKREGFSPMDLIKKKLHKRLGFKKSEFIITSTAKEYSVVNGLTLIKTRPILEQFYSDFEEVDRRNKTINDESYRTQYWKLKRVKFVAENLEVNIIQNIKYYRSDKYLELNKEALISNGLNRYDLVFYKRKPIDLIREFSRWYAFRALISEREQNNKAVRFIERAFIIDENGFGVPNASCLEMFLGELTNERTKDLKKRLRAAKNLENSKKQEAEIKDLNAKIKAIEEGVYQSNVLTLIAFLLNDSINMKSETELNVFREYNIFVRVDMKTIEKVCEWLGIEVREHDIRSCAWRIIYALLGLSLPDNFYGENKKNKGPLNIYLNTISAKAEVKRSQIKFKEHKNSKKTQLKNKGIPARVYNWLVDNFADKPSDEVFNTYTYHENEIIKEVMRLFPREASVVRRHDSILVFDFNWGGTEGLGILESLKRFKYLNQYGWFFDEVVTEEKRDEIDIDSVINDPIVQSILYVNKNVSQSPKPQQYQLF
jgi:hypothetical protein